MRQRYFAKKKEEDINRRKQKKNTNKPSARVIRTWNSPGFLLSTIAAFFQKKGRRYEK